MSFGLPHAIRRSAPSLALQAERVAVRDCAYWPIVAMHAIVLSAACGNARPRSPRDAEPACEACDDADTQTAEAGTDGSPRPDVDAPSDAGADGSAQMDAGSDASASDGALPDAALDEPRPDAARTGDARADDAGDTGPNPCDGGLTLCGDACVDTQHDVLHCSRCFSRCEKEIWGRGLTPVCDRGLCWEDCYLPCGPDAGCVNLQTSPVHCGACDSPVPSGFHCADGHPAPGPPC